MIEVYSSSDNWRGFQFKIGLAMQHRLSRIKAFAHWIYALLPGVIVEDEIAEARVTFEDEPEQILCLAFVPVGGVNLFADANNTIFRTGQMSKHVHPTSFAFAIEHASQVPSRSLFDDKTAEAVMQS